MAAWLTIDEAVWRIVLASTNGKILLFTASKTKSDYSKYIDNVKSYMRLLQGGIVESLSGERIGEDVSGIIV
jgi:hypothetical protein